MANVCRQMRVRSGHRGRYQVKVGQGVVTGRASGRRPSSSSPEMKAAEILETGIGIGMVRERRGGRMEEYEECNAAAYAHSSCLLPPVSHAWQGISRLGIVFSLLDVRPGPHNR